MAGQGGPIVRYATLAIVVLVLLEPAQAAPSMPAIADAAREDAELADVLFLDPLYGWAVGDRGVIWHTADGGRNWQIQTSRVDCRLESIYFLDQQRGWIAGGYFLPYSEASRGVLLSTRDGGRTWQSDSKLLLPALKRVRFFNDRQGIALGRSSVLFPSGLFATQDGGLSWTALGSDTAGDWLAGHIESPGSVALAGRAGTAAVLSRNELVSAAIEDARWRNLRDLKLAPDRSAWLVGDGGLVRRSRDAARSWQRTPGPIPAAAQSMFDWSAVATHGNRCWIAGSPGSRILYSQDGGGSWSFASTGQYAPLRGLCFVDDQHGWAVGALGTILATVDGGHTWRRQLGTATHVALAAFCADTKHVPLELFGRFSAGDGYLGVAFLLTRHDLMPDARTTSGAAERLHQAMVSVGGCGAETAWQFPLSQPLVRLDARRIIAGWNRMSDGDGLTQLGAYIVRQIRCWRPEIVVTQASEPRDGDAAAQLVHQAVLRAVEDADDENRFPDQIAKAGLETWRVKKVYGVDRRDRSAPIKLSTAQLAPQLGRTLSDVAAPAWGLVSRRIEPLPESWGLRLYASEVPEDRARSDIFSGLVIAPGGPCRRRRPKAFSHSVDDVETIVRRIRNFQAILNQADRRQQYTTALWSQVNSLVDQLDPTSGSLVLLRLALDRQQRGRLDEATEAFKELGKRYPGEPVGPPALRWLLDYYASGEAALLVRQRPAIRVEFPTGGPDPAGKAYPVSGRPPRHESPEASTSDKPGKLEPTNDVRPQATQPDQASALEAQAVAQQIRQIDPVLYSEPLVRFPLAVALRKTGQVDEADRLYDAVLRHTPHEDAWWLCAASESWLRHRSRPTPKPVWHCTLAPSRPHLDGVLDDEVWQSARRIELGSPQGDDARWRAAAMIAYDRDFLFLALSCRRAPGCEYPASNRPRPRDADLSRFDRVDLLLDVDRDWTSYLWLSVDSRGWTREACLGSSTWNPTWFVAGDDDGRRWTIEAAIPLGELSPQPPRTGDAWAAGVQRIVPGVGFQSWSRPASPDVRPEGFGLLLFD